MGTMNISRVVDVLHSACFSRILKVALPFLLMSTATTALAGSSTISILPGSVTITGPATVRLHFPLRREGDISYDIWLRYKPVDGSAKGGTDYQNFGALMYMSAPDTSTYIPMSVFGASSPQPDKTFSLQVSSIAGVGPVPAFASQQAFAAGEGPSSVASKDVNGDGRPDLIVSNGLGVAVLLNTTAPGATAPSFAAPQQLDTGEDANQVTAADINSDGKPDLIIINSYTDDLSVMLNNTAPGSGTIAFGAQQKLATYGIPSFVATADINNDGKADLVVTNRDQNNVAVLLNTTAPGATDITFTYAQTFATGTTPLSVTAADVNGDGKLDLAVANNQSNNVSVLLNETAPGSTTAAFGSQQTFGLVNGPYAVVPADVNGDGRVDLMTADFNSASVSVFLNTTAPGAATPAFAPPQDSFGVSASASTSVAATDVNGDGKPDAIVADVSTDTVSVIVNGTAPGAELPALGDGQTFSTDSFPIFAITADINGDGKPDLITANANGDTVSVLLNVTEPGGPKPAFPAQRTFATGALPRWVSAADVNADGRPDLIAANSSSADNTVSVLLNTTKPGAAMPTFSGQQKFSTGAGPSCVIAADLNGDGRPDLAAADTGADAVSVLLNATAPGAAVPVFAGKVDFPTGTGPACVTAADVNSDGEPDLLVPNAGSDTISVLLNETAPGASVPSFAAGQLFTTGSGPEYVAVADINGDGMPDLVVPNLNDNDVAVLLNTAAPGASALSFAAAQTFATGTHPDPAAVADVNGDGKPDVIVGNIGDDNVSVLLNTTVPGATTPAFAVQQTFAIGSGIQSLAAADMDGDGRPDLEATNSGDNTVSVRLNTTAPGASVLTFADLQPFTTGPAPINLAMADLNGDDRPDLITADDDGGASVLLNSQYAVTPTTMSVPAVIHYSMPFIEKLPGKLDFGDQSVSSAGVSKVLTVTNAGNAALTLKVAVSGNATADFVEDDGCPAELPADAGKNSCTITIMFAPTATGTRSATLTLTSNDPRGPQSVALVGTGTKAIATTGDSPAGSNGSGGGGASSIWLIILAGAVIARRKRARGVSL